jgi:outer membrane protein TolC
VKYKVLFLILAAVLPAASYAQTKLSLKEAIAITLENNYDIKMARNDFDVSDNNFTLGSAGFLPKVDLTASQTKNSNDTKQAYSDGTSVDKSSSKSTSTNAGVALTWTLFDGFKMFTTYSKLKEYKELGEMKLRAQLENSIADVIKTYYDLVRQLYTLNAAKESVQISEERVKLTQDKMDIGSASRFDLLRAKVDLNTDKSNMLNQEVIFVNLKVTLNNLLARDGSIEFNVDEEFSVKDGYEFTKLREIALKNNIDILQSEKNKSLSLADISLTRSEYYPKINFNSGFTYSNSEADAGFFKTNTTTGFNFGLSLTWNLFNGFNNLRDYENAKINLDKNQFKVLSVRASIESNLLISFRNYVKNIDILKLEEENVSVAKENLDLAIEQLKLGSLSAIDFRDVQKNYLTARSRLYTAYYTAKISERDLLKQSGILMQ